MSIPRSGVAWITGASSGIGWEMALVLAEHGWRLGLLARREDRLQDLARRVEAAGGAAVVLPADVGRREEVELAYQRLREQFGPPDWVIANAGIGRPTRIEPVNMDDIEATMRINLMGVVYTLSTALPDMLARRKGHLAAISSLAGYRGLPGESAYCASKAAINVYLDGLRIQLRGSGVRVTTICPGFILTPMTEHFPFHMPGLMDAPTAARRILRAIAAGKKVYNFPWHVHLLVKLSRWVPDALMHWFLQDYDTSNTPPDAVRAAEVPS